MRRRAARSAPAVRVPAVPAPARPPGTESAAFRQCRPGFPSASRSGRKCCRRSSRCSWRRRPAPQARPVRPSRIRPGRPYTPHGRRQAPRPSPAPRPSTSRTPQGTRRRAAPYSSRSAARYSRAGFPLPTAAYRHTDRCMSPPPARVGLPSSLFSSLRHTAKGDTPNATSGFSASIASCTARMRAVTLSRRKSSRDFSPPYFHSSPRRRTTRRTPGRG